MSDDYKVVNISNDYIGTILLGEFNVSERRIQRALEDKLAVERELSKCSLALTELKEKREQLREELGRRGIDPYKSVD